MRAFATILVVLAGCGAAAASAQMLIEHDVTVDAMVSDRFTWSDASGSPRVAVLDHNDGQLGPTTGYPNHGGSLIEFRYQVDGGTRVCSSTDYGNAGYGGFGYVVSHRGDGSDGIGGDDSPLGFAFTGAYQRVFEGRHHAIFRFTQLYPRYSSTTANPPNTLYWVPVTIEWLFATGRDHPTWAVTWDLSGVPAGALNDDSRAPYGELNFDGVGAENVSGVAWGDRWKFTSTLAPVTLDSTWTWNVPNTVPWVKLWIEATNATMGIVQTQTLTQHDAGAGRNPWWHDLTPYWNTTSAAGNAGGGDVMPWQDSWPYQANSFSLGPAGPPPSGSSNDPRLTWGTMYGFLGQQDYDPNDGVVPVAHGWPMQSYSAWVVFGKHTLSPVEAQVAQEETVQTLALSTTTGSVAAGGPAGAGRADTADYHPPGWDQVYGALAFVASGNALDANVGVGAGTLTHPLVVVRSYTASWPTVKLGGLTLAADVDYFASLRAAANELWITLNRDLTGGTNHLEVIPPATAPGQKLYVVSPCRLFDTRNATGPDAAAPSLSAGETRVLALGGRCGIPIGAKAISANAVAVGPAAPGYFTLYPADAGGAPLVSTINFAAYQTRANNAVIALAADGSGIAVLNGSGGVADLVLDVNGYFQ